MRAARRYEWENLLFLDIETVRVEKELPEEGPLYDAFSYGSRSKLTFKELQDAWIDESALYAEFAKVVCISVGWVREDILYLKSFYGLDEHKLLDDFNDFISKYRAQNSNNTLAGHAVIGFDIPFIFKRMLVNHIEPDGLLDTGGLKPWEVDYLDTKDLWKASGFKPSSLAHISYCMGIPSPKHDLTGADVGRVYYEAEEGFLDRIEAYCCEDVIAPVQIVRKWRGEEMVTIQRARQSEEEKIPLLMDLFAGGKITTKNRDELKKAIQGENMTHVGHILDALVASKTSKVTKNQVEKFYDYIS